MKQKLVLSTLASLILVGCGGSKSTVEPVVVNGVPQLNEMTLSLKPLKKVKQNNFEQHYKNGLYLSVLNDDGIRYFTTGAGAPEASASADAAQSSFSSTITQEVGVDEADRVKYDGSYLYIANRGGYDYSRTDVDYSELEYIDAHVRVMKRNADSSLTEVGSLAIDDEDRNRALEGMFLDSGRLSVISSMYSYGIATDFMFDIWHPGPQKFNLTMFDVSTPESASKTGDIDVDGYVISSRRVDDSLIIVSSYSPYVEGLITFPQSDEEKEHNYNLLQSLDVNSLLPKYTTAAGEKRNLVTADDCFIPEDATAKDGYDSIVTLTTVNVNNPDDIKSVCINASMAGIYATPSSVYVYGSKDLEQSVVHKFAIDTDADAISYSASANFDGHVFGRGPSNLRFSEQGDYLRIVSSRFTDDAKDRFDHQLQVFKSNAGSNSLSLVAQLPNENHPEKLGKDNEDIYAVRYFGSKAYIVTFESIDPLYVVNLADNTQPFVESALEIVGYSSYLHPISENLILGVGQNVDPNRFTGGIGEARSSNTSTSGDEQIEEGAKVALFDVSGEPRLVKEFVFANSYTPAEYNYHALTYLKKSDNKHWFALPTESWSTTYNEEKGYDEWYSHSQLQLIEVDDNGAGGAMEHVGAVVPVNEENSYVGSWDDRSVIHGDVIYYVHGAKVWQSLWQDPKASTVGPF